MSALLRPVGVELYTPEVGLSDLWGHVVSPHSFKYQTFVALAGSGQCSQRWAWCLPDGGPCGELWGMCLSVWYFLPWGPSGVGMPQRAMSCGWSEGLLSRSDVGTRWSKRVTPWLPSPQGPWKAGRESVCQQSRHPASPAGKRGTNTGPGGILEPPRPLCGGRDNAVVTAVRSWAGAQVCCFFVLAGCQFHFHVKRKR